MSNNINDYLSINYKTNHHDKLNEVIEMLVKNYTLEAALHCLIVKFVHVYGTDKTLLRVKEIITLKQKRYAWLPKC